MKAAPVSFRGWPSSASYKKAGGFDSRIGKSRFQGEWKQTPEPSGSARRKGIGAIPASRNSPRATTRERSVPTGSRAVSKDADGDRPRRSVAVRSKAA